MLTILDAPAFACPSYACIHVLGWPHCVPRNDSGYRVISHLKHLKLAMFRPKIVAGYHLLGLGNCTLKVIYPILTAKDQNPLHLLDRRQHLVPLVEDYAPASPTVLFSKLAHEFANFSRCGFEANGQWSRNSLSCGFVIWHVAIMPHAPTWNILGWWHLM